jgi:serine/threonine protein kinase
LNTPRILGVYADINTVVFEEADGKELSRLVPIYFLPHTKKKKKKTVKRILRIVAKSTAELHNMTRSRGGPNVTSFNDLKLGNVLFDGETTKIIDFEMVKSHYMEDITSMLVSIEMLGKFPYITNGDLEDLKTTFMKVYSNKVRWKIDEELLERKTRQKREEIFETLTEKRYRRGLNTFSKLIVEWNVLYLKGRM